MVDLVFQRDKAASEGQKSAPSKNALATVDLTQTSLAGQRIVTHKAFADSDFGAAGVSHKVVFLEGATCIPLVVEARAGKSSKTARLGFRCDPVQASN